MKNKFRLFQAGFSLPELLVAAGLLGALSMGVMRLMENSTKVAKNIENKDEITRFTMEIADVLNNPNNCEASLGGRGLGATVPIIYQVLNGVAVPKFQASNNPSNKVSIQSMNLKSVDNNGSNGSQSLATLEVSFKKPDANVMGGKIIKKEIKLDANLCRKNIIANPDVKLLMNECSGPHKRLIEGPYSWNSTKWAVCQDCEFATENIVNFCQSQAAGSFDVSNMNNLSCLSMGGTFNESTSTCLFDGKTLSDYIDQQATNVLPECSFLSACGGKYPVNTGTFIIKQFANQNYTHYNRTCWATYTRKGGPICSLNYNSYGHCGSSTGSHAHAVCNTGGRVGNETCNPGGAGTIHDCDGCGSGCFEKNGYDCSTTGTETRTEQIEIPITIYKCCKS